MEKTTKPIGAGIKAMIIIVVIVLGTVAIVTMQTPYPGPYYPTPSPSPYSPTPEPYVMLRVEASEVEHHWARDSFTDLPCYVSAISYTLSNDGTAYADNVAVIVALDGETVRSLGISLPSQGYQTDNIQLTFEYDTLHTVSVEASSPTSADAVTLSIDATLPRYFLEEVASLYITPNDVVVRTTLDQILRSYPLIPKWVAIRDWVANNIKYAYDESTYGRGYWQLPRETLQLGTGDCEDYAILLVSLYRAVGYGADRVYVVGGQNENGEGHAWVRIQIDVIGWQNIEPQAPALLTFVGDHLILSGFTAYIYFNDVYTYYTKP